MSTTIETILLYTIAAGFLSIVYGFFTGKNILNQSAGNAKMQEIASAIQIGAKAYLSRQYKNGLTEAFKEQKTKFLIISFSSDWLYPTKQSKDIVIALNASGANVAFAEIKTDKGHDSFLVNEPKFLNTI